MTDFATDHDLPPGTFRLYEDAKGSGEGNLLLVPQPSSDPNEPLNWSKWRKFVNFTLVLAVSITVFTGLSTQIIFWQLLVVDLETTYAALNSCLSMNGVGLSLGCFLFIPLALKYGRRPIYIVSTGLFFITMVWSSRVQSVKELYAVNLIAGLAGAVNESIVGITIADLFFVHQRGTMNGLYLIMVMSGSFLTPMLAGVQATYQSWRWSYYLLSVFTGILFLAFIFFYEESKHIPMITSVEEEQNSGPSSGDDLTRLSSTKKTPEPKTHDVAANASFQRRIDPDIPVKSWKQRLAWTTPTGEPLMTLVVRPVIVLGFPTVMFTALQYASGLSWLVVLSSTLSTVFPYPPYNFTPAMIGYMGVGPFTGNLIGSLYSGPLTDRAIVWFSKKNGGMFEPEMRLRMLLLPSLAMAGGLVMFGLTVARGMHWIYPSVGGALYGFGLGAVGDISLTFVIDSYRDITGEAYVGISFIRNVFSIWIPFTITPWRTAMGIQNQFILMACLSLFISLLYIPMEMFGKKSRVAFAAKYREMSAQRA